jgi:hypothetical protein
MVAVTVLFEKLKGINQIGGRGVDVNILVAQKVASEGIITFTDREIFKSYFIYI